MAASLFSHRIIYLPQFGWVCTLNFPVYGFGHGQTQAQHKVSLRQPLPPLTSSSSISVCNVWCVRMARRRVNETHHNRWMKNATRLVPQSKLFPPIKNYTTTHATHARMHQRQIHCRHGCTPFSWEHSNDESVRLRVLRISDSPITIDINASSIIIIITHFPHSIKLVTFQVIGLSKWPNKKNRKNMLFASQTQTLGPPYPLLG